MEGKIDYFLAGMGTGGTICGVAKYLKKKDTRIVTIFPDSANRYLSSIYNDEWLKEKGIIS
jgi:cystathionine beta-synthase